MCFTKLPYSSKLDVVPQGYGNSVSPLHTSLLQASGEGIGVSIERFICEDSALVVRDDTIGIELDDAPSWICRDNSRVAVAELPHDTRKVLRYGLFKERRLLASVAVQAQGLGSHEPRLVPDGTLW